MVQVQVRRTTVDSLPLQLRGAVAVGNTAAGGSFLSSGQLRALCYIVGQLCSVLSWCCDSWRVAKLPCAASSLPFINACAPANPSTLNVGSTDCTVCSIGAPHACTPKSTTVTGLVPHSAVLRAT